MKGINCELCKFVREFFVYGGMELLLIFGIFIVDVLLIGNNSGCRVDFVVVKGDG